MLYRIRHPTEVWTQRWQPHREPFKSADGPRRPFQKVGGEASSPRSRAGPGSDQKSEISGPSPPPLPEKLLNIFLSASVVKFLALKRIWTEGHRHILSRPLRPRRGHKKQQARANQRTHHTPANTNDTSGTIVRDPLAIWLVKGVGPCVHVLHMTSRGLSPRAAEGGPPQHKAGLRGIDRT